MTTASLPHLPQRHSSAKRDELQQALTAHFGPLVGGDDLRRQLGFKTAAAFERAVRLQRLGVRTFNLPGRRGRFALSVDIADWLFANAYVVDDANQRAA